MLSPIPTTPERRRPPLLPDLHHLFPVAQLGCVTMNGWDSKAVEAANNRLKPPATPRNRGGRHKDATRDNGVADGAETGQEADDDQPATTPALDADPGPWHVAGWTIYRATGLTGHRLVCQAPQDADAEKFIAYLQAYNPCATP